MGRPIDSDGGSRRIPFSFRRSCLMPLLAAPAGVWGAASGRTLPSALAHHRIFVGLAFFVKRFSRETCTFRHLPRLPPQSS